MKNLLQVSGRSLKEIRPMSEALAHLSTACFKQGLYEEALEIFDMVLEEELRREKQSFSEKGLVLKALGEVQGGFSYL